MNSPPPPKAWAAAPQASLGPHGTARGTNSYNIQLGLLTSRFAKATQLRATKTIYIYMYIYIYTSVYPYICIYIYIYIGSKPYLKSIKIGRKPCKTEFFDCSFGSPSGRPEISNIWGFHAQPNKALYSYSCIAI